MWGSEFEPGEVAAYRGAAQTGRRVRIELRDPDGRRIFRVRGKVVEVDAPGNTALEVEVAIVLEVPAAILRDLPAARPRPDGGASYPPSHGIGKLAARRRRGTTR
jgi:hypothetical protein